MIDKRITPIIAPTTTPVVTLVFDAEAGRGGGGGVAVGLVLARVVLLAALKLLAVVVLLAALKLLAVVVPFAVLMPLAVLVLLAVLVDVGRFEKSIEAALGSMDAALSMTLEQMEAISAV